MMSEGNFSRFVRCVAGILFLSVICLLNGCETSAPTPTPPTALPTASPTLPPTTSPTSPTATTYTCHHYNAEEDNDWCKRRSGYVYTQGNNAAYAGVENEDCWCIKTTTPITPPSAPGDFHFQVWGPDAISMYAIGHWDAEDNLNWIEAPYWTWDNTSGTIDGPHYLTKDSGNIWRGSIATRSGGQFALVVETSQGRKLEADPYCTLISKDANYCIVPEAYEWNTTRVTIDRSVAVVYEMQISRFTAAGTFEAAISELDYLKNLGVNMLELLPVFAYPKDWGDRDWAYGPMSAWAIEGRLGGPNGLKRFVDEAAKRGMAVALDVVYNHWAGHVNVMKWNPPFWNSEDTVWGPLPDFGGWVSQYFAAAQDYLMDEFHIGGFRYDVSHCIRLAGKSNLGGCAAHPEDAEGKRFLQGANEAAHQRGVLTFAEDFWNLDQIPDELTQRPGIGFDTFWNVDWFHSIVDEVVKPGNLIDLNRISGACASSHHHTIFGENHDLASEGDRVPNFVNADKWWKQKKSMMVLGFMLTCPGIPMILQGQEYMSEVKYLHGKSALEDTEYIFDTIRAKGANKNAVKEVTDMIKLRTDPQLFGPGLSWGEAKEIHRSDLNSATDKVIVMHRSAGGRQLLIIYNLNDVLYPVFHLVNAPQDGTWSKRFDGDQTQYAIEGIAYDDACRSQSQIIIHDNAGDVCVPKLSMLVFSLD